MYRRINSWGSNVHPCRLCSTGPISASQILVLSGNVRLATGVWARLIQIALLMQICFSEMVRRHVCCHRFFTALSISFPSVFVRASAFMDITTDLKAFN